jgi:hypothetical protein
MRKRVCLLEEVSQSGSTKYKMTNRTKDRGPKIAESHMVCHKNPHSTYATIDGLRRSEWPFKIRLSSRLFMASLRFMGQRAFIFVTP